MIVSADPCRNSFGSRTRPMRDSESNVSIMQFGMIEKRPAFERFWKRISARPATARARDLDDALLPPKQRMGSKT